MPSWTLFVGFLWLMSTVTLNSISAVRTYDAKRLTELREEVRSMFYHAYDSYIRHAYPYDELRPLTCDGVDTWGSYSLTLIDTLDTLAVMGNYSEFRRVAKLIIDNAHFDLNINVSVFETNIRIIGGLLSAHLLSHKAGMEVEKGWPCNGPLLRLAEKVARKLLPAFDTKTGMPYGTVNLRYGVPPSETPITCTAGVGTFIVEFGALSRLTGDPLYEKVALRAIHSLYAKRSSIDLFGNHIDTSSGKWTAVDSGIGAGVDSFFEYLVKGGILFQRPELMHMFRVSYHAIEKHLGKGGWYIWATMNQGHVSTPAFSSLETYWPGLLSLIGEFKTALKSITNYHRILKQYGGIPELYNILQGKASHQREGYPLRPELIESAMYLYRATEDPQMLEIGEDFLHSIEHVARTECGYATIRDVTTMTLEDRMESFFLAETIKYLYLLFDPDNFIHSDGTDYTVVESPVGKCTVYAGGYIFNTEAHPIDPSALHCCTGVREQELHDEIQHIDEVPFSKKFTGMSNKRKEQRRKKKKKGAKKQDSEMATTVSSTEIDDEFRIELNHGIEIGIESTSSIGSCRAKDFAAEMRNLPRKQPPSVLQEPESPDEESMLDRLLRRLFEEHSVAEKDDKKVTDGDKSKVSSPDQQKKGLKFVTSDEAERLQKMVKSFESNVKALNKRNAEQSLKQQSASPKTTENRIRTASTSSLTGGGGTSPKVEKYSGPDLDLIFGTGTSSRSLSFYFSLKWLKSFPDLVKQLIPAEKFDIQAFYSRMSDNEQFSDETYAKDFNFTVDWSRDYQALRCPRIGIPERFMFLRPSVEE
ncbi:unnamed protein product [Orchesella dallaii]|uniref:alpha-1,2-Mannosidase n=1 Tax=Orchesella dallaii TaxID=48710 RepID=A0ABP1QI19_9HEXA